MTRITKAQIKAWQEKKQKNKYNAEKVFYDGIWFDSRLEKSVYCLLKLRERAGKISDIKVHETVYITRARIGWKVDFNFFDEDFKERRYAEAKGPETPDYLIKIKLWGYYGLGPLELWKGTEASPYHTKTIVPVVIEEVKNFVEDLWHDLCDKSGFDLNCLNENIKLEIISNFTDRVKAIL